jgi:hypothetical protein
VTGERRVDATSRVARRLAVGAGIVTLGLVLVGSAHPDVGGVTVLSGWVVLGMSLHAFGRRES